MGCGASKQPPAASSGRSSFVNATSSRGGAYWDRQQISEQQWTAHSTMAVAKQAQANGMPEPPEVFFETQDRLVRFFQEHGKLLTFNPGEVVLEPGTGLMNMMIVEEGAVLSQKEINLLPPKVETKPVVDQRASAMISRKNQEKTKYRRVSGQLAIGVASENGAAPESAAPDGAAPEGVKVETEEQEGDEAEAEEEEEVPAVTSTASQNTHAETLTLSTLEKDELLGQAQSRAHAIPSRLRSDPIQLCHPILYRPNPSNIIPSHPIP